MHRPVMKKHHSCEKNRCVCLVVSLKNATRIIPSIKQSIRREGELLPFFDVGIWAGHTKNEEQQSCLCMCATSNMDV